MASCGKHVANATVANRLELPFLVTEPMAVDLDKLIWRLGKLNAPKARFCGTRSFQIESYKYNCLVGPQQAIYICVCVFFLFRTLNITTHIYSVTAQPQLPAADLHLLRGPRALHEPWGAPGGQFQGNIGGTICASGDNMYIYIYL